MATSKLQELEILFDDHPSLDASLQDFEHGSSDVPPSPCLRQNPGYPSHHSGFRSDSDSDSHSPAPSGSNGRYSPPAWRRDDQGNRSSGFWDRVGVSRGDSRESSPDYESADDGEDETLAAAMRTRLPTGSLSPEKQGTPASDGFEDDSGDDVFGAVEGKEVGIPETPSNCKRCLSV
jgi:hypothetical protein